MTTARIVAPGKLMLAGEYSVLGPTGEALAIAVQPGVEATCEPSSTWRLVRGETGETWEDGSAVTEAFTFAHAAILAAQKAFTPVAPLTITTRSLQAASSGGKRGLGTSASATVAVAAAVQYAATGAVDHRTLLPVALDAHTTAQQGRGSGYDVATIVYGGLVRWRPARLAGEAHSPYEVTRLTMPDSLHLLAAYSGKSASTTQFIQRIESHSRSNPAQLVQEYNALSKPVGGLIDALQDGDVAGALAGGADRLGPNSRLWNRDTGNQPADCQRRSVGRSGQGVGGRWW